MQQILSHGMQDWSMLIYLFFYFAALWLLPW